jgi:capsular polysaccharide export protein
VATTRGNAFPVIGVVPSQVPGRRVATQFLRIPPFPGAKIHEFSASSSSHDDAEDVADELRRLRVGGAYWGPQPELPERCFVVRASGVTLQANNLAGANAVVLWDVAEPESDGLCINGDCDPWHVLSDASGLVVGADDDIRLVARLLGVPVYIADEEELVGDDAAMSELLRQFLPRALQDPFTGETRTVREAIELCGFWRRLIDSNRDIAGGLGFAFWKQEQIATLLWNGSNNFRFLKSAAHVPPEAKVAVWRSKAPPQILSDLERSGSRLIEVEDGFLRSRGLGADCVPPMSITVDASGAYFDPAQPSDLERLLQDGSFDADLLARAAELRETIVQAGIGKYEQGGPALNRPAGERVHILVPGQVEDDRAVQSGGCGLTSNLELLKRVRAQAPDAYVLYKPHPDVLAGHRRGEIASEAALNYADEIVDHSISSLIAIVDEVHVNTSLAGFEALLREKKVTAYGVPFYAGWGLTTDLGPVPSRRSTTRSLNELVAATLLVYPRYLDPITGLPCPAEIVVARLATGDDSDLGLLVGVRRLQGKFMRRLRSLVQ